MRASKADNHPRVETPFLKLNRLDEAMMGIFKNFNTFYSNMVLGNWKIYVSKHEFEERDKYFPEDARNPFCLTLWKERTNQKGNLILC